MRLDRARAGRTLLRWWFPRARTPHCATQAVALRREAQELAELGVDVVGLSFDAPVELAQWRAELGLPFVLQHASVRQAAELGALRPVGDPWRATLAARVATLVDDEGTVLAHWAVDDPSTFAEQIREKLAAVRAA